MSAKDPKTPHSPTPETEAVSGDLGRPSERLELYLKHQGQWVHLVAQYRPDEEEVEIFAGNDPDIMLESMGVDCLEDAAGAVASYAVRYGDD